MCLGTRLDRQEGVHTYLSRPLTHREYYCWRTPRKRSVEIKVELADESLLDERTIEL